MTSVVFDLDHTLFDRYATMTRCIPLLCKRLDIALSEEQATALLIYADRNYTHIGWDKMLVFLNENGMFRKCPEFNDFAEALFEAFRSTSVPFWFAVPTIERLREMGYKIGLITNGSSETQRAKLGNLGLLNTFDEIIISGEYGIGKPDTAPFYEMARRLDTETCQMYYVGDNPKNDVEASRKAGCVPIWVNTTGTWVFPEIEKPELIVRDVSELPDLLNKNDK